MKTDLEPLDLRRIPRNLPSSAYKLGDEFKPFHPQASHVPPEYRDGWNRCWLAALPFVQAAMDYYNREIELGASPDSELAQAIKAQEKS